MKIQHLLILTIALSLSACGPNKAQLRAELRSIESEMLQLKIAAEQRRTQLNAAQFDAFIGSFAASYGAVSGDYDLADEGASTAYQGYNQANFSSYSFDQIQQRFNALSMRRSEIVRQLH